jgi:hypothetical protein
MFKFITIISCLLHISFLSYILPYDIYDNLQFVKHISISEMKIYLIESNVSL